MLGEVASYCQFCEVRFWTDAIHLEQERNATIRCLLDTYVHTYVTTRL